MVYCVNFTNHQTLLEEVETKTDINELKLIVKTLVRENRILTHRFNILLKTIKNQNNLINYLQEILESMMAQAERTKNELSCILTELAYCAFDTVMRSQLIINRLAKNFLFENLQKSELDELNEIAQTVPTEDVNWTQRKLISYLKKIQGEPNSGRDSPKKNDRKSNESQLPNEEDKETTVENSKKSSYLQMRKSRKNSSVLVKKQSNHRSKRTSSVSSGKRSRRASSVSEANEVAHRSKRASSVSSGKHSRRALSVCEANEITYRSKRTSSVSSGKRSRVSNASTANEVTHGLKRTSSVSSRKRSRGPSNVSDGRQDVGKKLQERESEPEDIEPVKRKRQKSEKESLTTNGNPPSSDCKTCYVLPLKTCIVQLVDFTKNPETKEVLNKIPEAKAPPKTELPSKNYDDNDEYQIVDDVDASDEGSGDSDENEKSDSDKPRTSVEVNSIEASDSNSDKGKNSDSDSEYSEIKEESNRSQSSEVPNGKKGPRTPPSPYPYELLMRGPRTPPYPYELMRGPRTPPNFHLDAEGENSPSRMSENSVEVFHSNSSNEEPNSPVI